MVQTGWAPTAIDPATNFGDHENINRVRIYNALGVGIQVGNYSWSDTFESNISFNGTGIYVPDGTTTTGENLSLLNSYIQNNFGVRVEIDTGTTLTYLSSTLP